MNNIRRGRDFLTAEIASGYQIQFAYPNPDTLVCDAVRDFWCNEAALTKKEASDRANQLLAVVRNDKDEICATSTVRPTLVQSLGVPLFFYRTFIGRNHRTIGLRSTNLARRLLEQSAQYLSDRFEAGHDRNILGLYVELEKTSFLRNRRELVWTGAKHSMFYVGRTKADKECRVTYFAGARLPKLASRH